MMTKSDKWERRIHFDPPRDVAVMSTDGKWSAEAVLLEISATEARIRSPILRPELPELFLMLTRFGNNPVFRRCKRVWARGSEMGLTFAERKTGTWSLKEASKGDPFAPDESAPTCPRCDKAYSELPPAAEGAVAPPAKLNDRTSMLHSAKVGQQG
jgi:hypothetical protein